MADIRRYQVEYSEEQSKQLSKSKSKCGCRGLTRLRFVLVLQLNNPSRRCPYRLSIGLARMGSRGYSVKEDSAPYGNADFDFDFDSDFEPDKKGSS